MKRVMILLTILLSAFSARLAWAQQPATSNQALSGGSPKREGSITGRVIGEDGQPVAGAQVWAFRISDKRGSSHSANSDEDGNFKLTGLAPGAYILDARAPGFVLSQPSQDRVVYRIGERVTFNLVKGGVITGRVTDEIGEPVVAARVLAHRVRELEDKSSVLQTAMFSFGAITDDRGIYRIYGVRAGVYVVSVGFGRDLSPQIGRDAPTYHPSSTRDTAAEIAVRHGEEVSGVDIRNRGERGYVVSGVITGEIESAQQGSYVAVSLESPDVGRFDSGASIDRSQSFAIYGVPDGEYELSATQTNRDGETSGSAPRRVPVKGADVTGIELRLIKHASITGRVKIEVTGQPKSCPGERSMADDRAEAQIQEAAERRSFVEEIILKAERDDPAHLASRFQRNRFESKYGNAPSEQGEFTLKNLDAGRYRIVANLPGEGWYLRAVAQPGQSGQPATGAAKKPIDASRGGIAVKAGAKLSGVEVIIAEGAASLNGRVVPAKEGSKSPSRLRVYLIPAETLSADDVLRYAEAAIRDDGLFEFKHIAPGKYMLYARQAPEKEASDDQARPVAWDAIERAKLRREATAAKNEIELQPCQRVKDYILRFNR